MKLSRLLFILLGLFVLLAVATPLVGAWVLRRYVHKEFLILQAEKNINARVHLDDVTLTLFTWPPSLRLSGLKVAARDEFAGRPLAERPPLGEVPLKIDMAYAELVPEALMHRHFFPRVIRLIGLDVNETVSPGAGSDLKNNAKSLLQQIVQREFGATPQYVLLDENGPDHSKCFMMAVTIQGKTYKGAWGKNKKDAEMAAASNALSQIQNHTAESK